MRKLAVILIIAGIIVALYPAGERVYSVFRQRALLDELERALENDVKELEDSTAIEPEVIEVIAAPEKIASSTDSSAIGILVIEKIDLKIPVLRGMSKGNLRVGAGFLESSAEIGEEGNTVLAAHRAHTYGHLFNRLNELEEGDRVDIKTMDGVYEYEVYSNEVVESEDVSVLSSEEGETVLTLITCHPLYSKNPSYRIVVKAKRACHH